MVAEGMNKARNHPLSLITGSGVLVRALDKCRTQPGSVQAMRCRPRSVGGALNQ